MSVRCNPTASQQNMNKLSVSKLFSFIAGAVNTGDSLFASNISANFHRNLKWILQVIQGHGGN
jgi:hypothetical protein